MLLYLETGSCLLDVSRRGLPKSLPDGLIFHTAGNYFSRRCSQRGVTYVVAELIP